MYKSRLHFENENIHLAIDRLTGEVLEFADRRRHENLLKNAMFSQAQPFTVTLRLPDGEKELTAPQSRMVLACPELGCTVTDEPLEDGVRIRVTYPVLTDGKDAEKRWDVTFTYAAELRGGAVRWSCSLHNGTDAVICGVRFPVINGVWLGDDWQSNVLYYPYQAGERIANPVGYLAETPQTIGWRWQEYRYGYTLRGKGTPPALKERGLHGYAGRYPGRGVSMSWMELDGEGRGLYFGCHDPAGKPMTLECGVVGETSPGVCMAAGFEPRVAPDGDFAAPPVLTVLHDGDWHDGAAIYRAFRAPLITQKKPRPSWAQDSAGLFAHYDFKYQNGGVVHTYRDIPALAREALDCGFRHILLSGWHRDGFDNGFPMYEPDPDLGTEAELCDGIRQAKEMGVHVSFYMNVLIHNRRYEPETIDEKAVMSEDGTVRSESYGNPDVRFSAMCPQSRQWQEQIGALVRRATTVYGADGIYFDQLGTAPRFCFNPDHHHDFDGGSAGYRKILENVSSAYRETHGDELCLMGEWTVDLFGGLVDWQLNQTFFNYHTGGFPEMYRYTFPEHGMTDMLYPGENLAMRPVHVAQKSQEMMARLFCCGMYFWVYDLVDDNTFTRDPAGMERLRTVIRLSSLRKKTAPDALFRDTDGIHYADNGLHIRRFEGGGRDLLLAYALPGAVQTTVVFDDAVSAAVFVDEYGEETPLEVDGHMADIPARTGMVLLTRE